ncbi:MAG: alginate export family protein [Candidatus Sumerlaeaceae bacterium]|nr:alginate export family protein [Candidatus Sumerlaeaceae bacterium]
MKPACVIVFGLFLTTSIATPQAAAPATHKIGSVTVQGSFRTRMEAWDWFQSDTGDGSYLFSGNLLRLSFSQQREAVDWQVELAVPFLLGLPDNAVSTTGAQGQLGLGANYFLANGRSRNSAMLFPKQGFLRVKNLFGDKAQSLRFGRFEYIDGTEMTPKSPTLAALKLSRINQRLIGNFGWAHVGRSYDGAHYVYNKPTGNFTLMAGIPTRGVFQTDGWGWNRSGLGYAAYTKPHGKGSHAAETRLFAMYYHDWRQVLKTDNRPLAVRRGDLNNIRIGTFGAHSIHAVESKKGTFDVVLWGAGQTGRWGVQDHRGWAIAAEAGFQPKVCAALKPWFRGGIYEGSGDKTPGDRTHNTFFQILPTPRPYARFPFFDMMNNRDVMGSMLLRPHKNVTVSTEFHALSLAARDDLWYLGGGVFQPWTFGYVGRAANGASSLANLYDTSVDWRARPDLTFTFYYGYAAGRAAISSIYPKGKNGGLGYIELNYRF